MKILLDTNVILDIFLKRLPFYEKSKAALDLANYEEIDIYVSASTITDIYYITNRHLKDHNATRKHIINLLQTVHISSVTENEITKALDLLWSDFEDAVQYSVAFNNKIDIIVTRNPFDYKQSDIPIYTPQELMEMIKPYI